MDPVVQVLDPAIKVCLVVLPRQPVRSRRSVPSQRMERRPQHRDIDMMEKRGEPFLLPLLRSFPYAVQRL
jgi:hypothetical protein